MILEHRFYTADEWKHGDTLALCKVCGQGERQLQRVCPGPFRPIDRSPEALDAMFTILDWATGDAEAVELDPQGVADLKEIVRDLHEGERVWRWAYDAALRIWHKGYLRHLEFVQARALF